MNVIEIHPLILQDRQEIFREKMIRDFADVRHNYNQHFESENRLRQRFYDHLERGHKPAGMIGLFTIDDVEYILQELQTRQSATIGMLIHTSRPSPDCKCNCIQQCRWILLCPIYSCSQSKTYASYIFPTRRVICRREYKALR